MAHYAFIDDKNIVTGVIVGIDEDNTTDLPEEFASWEEFYGNNRGQTCKRTSYNTSANAHIQDGTPFRGNYAAIGYTYDVGNDVFIPPKPYDSWVMDETIWLWKAPVDKPALTDEQVNANNYYDWNEYTSSWDLITP